MTEQNNDSFQFEIILNMYIQKENKNYLFLIVSNEQKDFVIIFIQQSSYIYANKYYLTDLKKLNFINNYFKDLNKCNDIINIIKQIFNEKKDLIIIEEEQKKKIKISVNIQINVKGNNIKINEEKIEFILSYEGIEQKIKNSIICYINLYLSQENENNNIIKIEQEKKIEKLNQTISDLKGMIEELKYQINLNNKNNYNDFDKSHIINKFNIRSFDFIKKKIENIYNGKNVGFKMIYNAKENGDESYKFHKLCDNHKYTLVIVNTMKNIIFGGFASKTWNSLDLGRKKDGNSFIFSINKQKIYNSKKDDKKCQRYHLFCSDDDGPCFYAFSIDNLFLKNGGYCDEIEKCNYDSFENEYEINNGEKNFLIKELEVYKIILFDEIKI